MRAKVDQNPSETFDDVLMNNIVDAVDQISFCDLSLCFLFFKTPSMCTVLASGDKNEILEFPNEHLDSGAQ